MSILKSFDYDADHQWVKDLSEVFNYGLKSSPRGMDIHEIVGYRSQIDMKNPIIMNKTRRLGYKFMAAEAAWILSGMNDVATIAPYSKEISKFSDDGEVFFGAYGPKIREQLEYVVDTLVKDPDSRQAVINIWRESPGPSKDIPCTLSLQFILRQGVLHCVATMRSSDLWLGHPYDIVNFSCASFLVMLMVRDQTGFMLELGKLYLTAGSKHIYARNVELVGSVLQSYYDGKLVLQERYSVFDENRYSDAAEFIDHLWELADNEKGMLAIME